MKNCLVSVELGLENPDKKLPVDVSSIAYVALTRAVNLKDLFVGAIFPRTWEKLGKNECDLRRREVENTLKKSALVFAANHGRFLEAQAEQSETNKKCDNDEEWAELQNQQEPPARGANLRTVRYVPDAFEVNLEGDSFAAFLQPVVSERHVGIDQGFKNFAIAVVDKIGDEVPKVMSAKVYDLNLPARFKAVDVVVALQASTDLLSWMQLPGQPDPVQRVDRIIVHVEQIAIQNRNAKEFGLELGKLLQKLVPDLNTCIVKLSHCNLHRASGPTFQLGEKIVETLNLKPVCYQTPFSRKRVFAESVDDEYPNADYRHRKRMSADVFRYIVNADEEQLKDLKLAVDEQLAEQWKQRFFQEGSSIKLDDVGDALLHALSEILCGNSNYKQLAPSAPSLRNNRTIAVAVYPEYTYWVVIHCTYNTFTIENLGRFRSHLEGRCYKSDSTVFEIAIALKRELSVALSDWDGGEEYASVDCIKFVIKQLTQFDECGLTRRTAGTLTQSTNRAMKNICDQIMGKNSILTDRKDRTCGSIYVRIDRASGKSFQVASSTGKHTNVLLSALNWFNDHLPGFVTKRKLALNEHEKMLFFNTLKKLAKSGKRQLEMLHLSDTTRTKLASDDAAFRLTIHVRNFADLILVSVNKNQQHVKAVAGNYRKENSFTLQAKRTASDVLDKSEPSKRAKIEHKI
jgi:hypothetical protein